MCPIIGALLYIATCDDSESYYIKLRWCRHACMELHETSAGGGENK